MNARAALIKIGQDLYRTKIGHYLYHAGEDGPRPRRPISKKGERVISIIVLGVPAALIGNWAIAEWQTLLRILRAILLLADWAIVEVVQSVMEHPLLWLGAFVLYFGIIRPLLTLARNSTIERNRRTREGRRND